MQNLQAKISTQRHQKSRLQKALITLAKGGSANQQSNDRHNGGHSKLGVILEMARIHKALLHGTALVKYIPVANKKSNRKDANNR